MSVNADKISEILLEFHELIREVLLFILKHDYVREAVKIAQPFPVPLEYLDTSCSGEIRGRGGGKRAKRHSAFGIAIPANGLQFTGKLNR